MNRIRRLFFLILSVVLVDNSLMAADPANAPQSGYRRVDKNHPIYLQLKKNYTPEETALYRGKVDSFLANANRRGVLSDAVGEGLQYANYIDNSGIKRLITEIIQNYTPLIKIKVCTIVRCNESDSTCNSWFMYFPKNAALDKATEAIVFALRNLIDNGKVHQSFSGIKSTARLSFFFLNTRDDETQFSIFMNGNSDSFAQVLPPHIQDNGDRSSSSTSHLNGNIHNGDAALMIAVKKEMAIERIIYFTQGLSQEIRKLQNLISFQNELGMREDNPASPSSSSSLPTPTEKMSLWGKNGWILQNYVEANFKLQKQAADRFLSSKEQKDGVNPIYLHSDGFYYVDLGFKSLLAGSTVVLKLSKLNTEYDFMFEGWSTVTHDGVLAPLLEILPKPQWNIPTLDENLTESSFVFDAEHMYKSNKQRFHEALPSLTDQRYIEGLTRQLKAHVGKVLADKTYAEVSWYASGNNYIYCLPLYNKDKLILVAAFKPMETNSGRKLVMQTVLLPAWAYNNTRVLGAPKSVWMKQYAANFTLEEDSSQKARQKAEKGYHESDGSSGTDEPHDNQ